MKFDATLKRQSRTMRLNPDVAKTTSRVLMALMMLVATGASAADLQNVRQLSQDGFLRLSKDLAAVTALRALSPGVTLGVLGVDVGVEAGLTRIDAGDVWARAGGGSADVLTPRLTIHKGLAAGFDIGASVGAIGGTGIQTIGGILRYQFIEPGLVAPGATIRLTGNRELGSSNVTVRSLGADFVLAKPLPVITPYVGIGTVRTEVSAPGSSLSTVSTSLTRTFIGFDTKLLFATFSAEAEKTGSSTTISSKIGFRF